MFVPLAVFFSFLSASVLAAERIETGWSWCKDKNRDVCIKNALNNIIPSLATGKGDGIDPLIVERADNDYSYSNLSLDLFISDVVIVGIGSTRVQQVKSRTLEEGKLELMCKTPAVTATGLYQSDGYMATFPLHSEGDFNITSNDLTSVVMLSLESTGKHLKVSELKINVMPSSIEMTAGSQLDGDNSLGSALNLYLNENSFELYEVLRPKLMSWLSKLIRVRANAILSKTPASSIFPNLHI